MTIDGSISVRKGSWKMVSGWEASNTISFNSPKSSSSSQMKTQWAIASEKENEGYRWSLQDSYQNKKISVVQGFFDDSNAPLVVGAPEKATASLSRFDNKDSANSNSRFGMLLNSSLTIGDMRGSIDPDTGAANVLLSSINRRTLFVTGDVIVGKPEKINATTFQKKIYVHGISNVGKDINTRSHMNLLDEKSGVQSDGISKNRARLYVGKGNDPLDFEISLYNSSTLLRKNGDLRKPGWLINEGMNIYPENDHQSARFEMQLTDVDDPKKATPLIILTNAVDGSFDIRRSKYKKIGYHSS
jgi:hypothetical protein